MRLSMLIEKKPHLTKLKTKGREVSSTIIIANNIVDVGGAALSGAMAVGLFGHSPEYVIYIVSLTLALLYIATLIPKQYATHNPDIVLNHFGRVIIWMYYALKIFVTIIYLPVSPFLPKGGRDKMTHAELRSIIAMAESKSLIDPRQTSLIENIINITSLKTKDAMTDVDDIEFVESDKLVGDLSDIVLEGAHKRYVVVKRFKDKLYPLGILKYNKLVKAFISENKEQTVIDLMHPMTTMKEQEYLLGVFDKLNRNPDHITVVINEESELSGIIQADDVVYALTTPKETKKSKDATTAS
jgi:CBS domain containing-hemolysin-like protein